MRAEDERYFERLEAGLDEAFAVANAARERGGDPTPEVEIPVARDMADRVENILGIDGVAERVRDLEGEMSREEAALELVSDFVEGSVGDYDTRAGKIEGSVRTAVALLTEGVVAAPIEGIDRVELLENDDGTEFINVYYAGPIRSAGGTAQALSVLVADYARALLGIDEYRAREDEIGRYAEEVALYDEETGLQYAPTETEAQFIAEHMPIMLDGEATGDEGVEGYRDLDRVDTNAARGGMCLVLGEGIALKAPKIQRYTRELDEVDWPWLQDLIDGTYKNDGETDDAAADDESDESESAGGFRLRYGRSRNHGHATAGVHPATMRLVDDFLAPGTQIKTERPGKAAGVVPVDTIEGPTVRLANGAVRRIDDAAEALEIRNGVERILDLGEYLVNYGEFVENNHDLAPASYVFEWWVQEFEAAGAPVRAMRDSVDVDLADPTPDEALEWASENDAPLHPKYTYLWHDVSVAATLELAQAIEDAEVATADGETLLVEHTQGEDQLTVPVWRPLVRTLGFEDDLTRAWTAADVSEAARSYADGDNTIELVNEVAPFTVRERAPTRIGNRMGRPEKSEERELSPAVHTLFPLGDAGGSQRDVDEATMAGDSVNDEEGKLPDIEVGRRRCVACETETYWPCCPDCGGVAEAVYVCPDCDSEIDPDESGRAECAHCETLARPTQYTTIDLKRELRDAKANVGERASAYDVLKGVKGLSSKEKTPEPLEKGILRAKHDVSAFKDGTVRYDMTDLPVTAVRPGELDVTVEQFRELGYHEDVNGDPLRHDDQLVELKVQDVVLSDGAAEHMLKTADFVDDLLESYYGLDPYYEFTERDDLVGELVFGMAPHTSAAVIGRIIGFTSAAVGYAHPYFHASKRRNCDGDEDCVMLLLDGLLNFSIKYLPNRRGGRMDAPLVMSSRIDPAEIDDEAHNVDIMDKYPREFYEATRELRDPSDVEELMTIAEGTLGTDREYTEFRHTHDTADIAAGPDLSAYKTLGSMEEKMDAQLSLSRKLRAVDETDVAERIIEFHFLP
ncbi:DNA polymerase II large subunit, partial [Halobacteriales archaeon SW_10_66_29]